MLKKQQELLNSQNTGERVTNLGSSEEKATNTELVERIPIQDTPFEIIVIDGERCFVSIGKYKMSPEMYGTAESALMWFDKNKWHVILELIHMVCYELDEKKRKEELRNDEI